MGRELYRTWGSIRGDCGHVQLAARAAEECIENDSNACMKGNGRDCNSDRAVRIVQGRFELRNYDTTRGPGKRYLANL